MTGKGISTGLLFNIELKFHSEDQLGEKKQPQTSGSEGHCGVFEDILE